MSQKHDLNNKNKKTAKKLLNPDLRTILSIHVAWNELYWSQPYFVIIFLNNTNRIIKISCLEAKFLKEVLNESGALTKIMVQ